MELRREDGGAKAAQEAEFAVLSSIAVREQHKAKLRLIIDPPDTRVQVRAKSLTKRVKSPEGLEIHVLGDLLLLTRAASVDVVEKIQAWRDVVHRGIPRPYIYDKENYLLSMCEDVDFLDEVGDLVEWLGFRRVRNPFIVNEALDDVESSQLGIRVHDGRSLKYWHSASWRQNNKLVSRQNGIPTALEAAASKPRQRSRDRWKKQPPPRSLVKPLASISPEDDVVDGSRIAAAQEILLEEESFHGRLRALKTAHEYVDRGPSIFETGDVGNNAEAAAVYDAIAIVNSKLKKVEFHSSLLRRERGQVERTLQDLNNQVKWTEFRRDCDRTKDHRVWHFRDTYRQEALKTYAKLAERLQCCLTVLSDEDTRFQRALDMHTDRMRGLRLEKDNQRAARHDRKQKEEAARRQGIGKAIQERGSKLRAKKQNLKKHRQADSESPNDSSEWRRSSPHEDIQLDIQSDIRVLVGRKSSSPDRSQGSLEIDERQLDEKRQTAIYKKRARLEQQTRLAKEKEMALDRRRAENVAMKWEDALSRAVEREGRRRARLRTRKAMLERVESCAIFKCTNEMNRKRFLISVYTRNARGYEFEGLRIVAYDPISSAAFTMVMTLREFNSLGYGRTSEGLGAFCKWLCLLYEKRRRQFRLVWSGAPFPPPLRVRENDQALVCIHKEGVKMRRASADSFALVAVYLRTDNRSIVRFVVGAWHGHEFLLTEHAVEARDLIIGSDLDAQWKASGHPTIVWKHNADAFKSEESNALESLTTSIGMRVYSSEIVVNRVRYSVHVHDTNESEYTVELIPKPKKDKHAQAVIPSDTHRLILHKRQINPYDVHLSSSSFADLLFLTRFEQIPSRSTKPGGDGSDDRNSVEWKATVSPKWAGKLANYVRVFRLAKCACKAGGVFCFVTVSVVQQKTEFRAHLLLEVTLLPSTLSSSSSSLGGAESQQLIRIPLSEYLRCANVSRRYTAGLGYGEGEDECTACLTYTTARAKFYDSDVVVDTTFDYSTNCSNCAMIQYRRLNAIKELVIHAGTSASESLELIYHAYCQVCTRLAPPVVLVLGSAFSGPTPWLLPLLGYYFSCFDCDHYGLFKFVEGGEGHAISETSIQMRDIVLQTLARDQIIVIYNADCGVTVASANVFVNELHWWLYPDCSELPCHVAFIVTDERNDLEHDADNLQRDFDLLEALRALNHAACQLAELDPVHLDDAGGEGTDRASAFDAYLVAEAVLVEATRVLLHPDYAWHKPRKIVGASSWSSACSFLLDPVRLSAALQRCDPLQLSAVTAEVLDAYFMHAKWPLDYPNVRPFFHGLLACMMHVQHVRQLLALKSGSLQSEMMSTTEKLLPVSTTKYWRRTPAS
ncbi:hypothetical protein PF008_g21648 [Phytophthora fragariae]|uniref:Uncharacterized protein n=1 Tax=Phytophthora fragariae TaxID=53985 RepID=A0A6G0QVY3_9STRA|nr:hypothetical protein PF008_g21648 [Phytophthora fragariae]